MAGIPLNSTMFLILSSQQAKLLSLLVDMQFIDSGGFILLS